jgi:hypothetical protein
MIGRANSGIARQCGFRNIGRLEDVHDGAALAARKPLLGHILTQPAALEALQRITGAGVLAILVRVYWP